MVEISFVVNKEFLKMVDGSLKSRALRQTVSIHETLESALKSIRDEKLNILSLHELNALKVVNVDVLTIDMEEYRDGELHDIEGMDVYGVLKYEK